MQNVKYKDTINKVFSLCYNHDNGKFSDLFNTLQYTDLDNLFTQYCSKFILGTETETDYENLVLSIYNTYYDLWFNFAAKLIDSPFIGKTIQEVYNENDTKNTTNRNVMVNDTQLTDNGQTENNGLKQGSKVITETDNNIENQYKVYNDMQTYNLMRNKFVELLFLRIY